MLAALHDLLAALPPWWRPAAFVDGLLHGDAITRVGLVACLLVVVLAVAQLAQVLCALDEIEDGGGR